MIYLPQICPQPDWHNLIPEISDHSTTDTSFWVSGYRKGKSNYSEESGFHFNLQNGEIKTFFFGLVTEFGIEFKNN